MSAYFDLLAPDVLFLGGGNAALCAAITARRAGAEVLMLETAPKPERGGNSMKTRNFRCMHQCPKGHLIVAYDEDEYFDDLLKVTGGNTDENLARLAIRASEQCYDWMQENGVHFQPPLSSTLSLSRTNAFFLGGGIALFNAYYRQADNLGVKIIYEANATHLEFDQQRINWVEAGIGGETRKFTPKAVVAASGGFEANIDWLEDAWGTAAKNFLVRGTPHNMGAVLRDLLDQGIESVGDPTQCHAVAIDRRAPKFDGGIVTRLDCDPFSIVVNRNAERIYDEWEDVWPKRYAIWGRLIAAQPDQVGYAIIDSKSLDLFMPSVYPPIQAGTIVELARKLGLPEDILQQTDDGFNNSCGKGEFLPTELDGLSTEGLCLPKTNWARPITDPPFYGFEWRTGVTFTYLGLKVDENAQVQSSQDPVENLWAAGEIMAGSILGQGYMAGFGMTIGTVFGRLAGEGAADHAK